MYEYNYSKYPVNAEQLKDEMLNLNIIPIDIAYADEDRQNNLKIIFNEELDSIKKSNLDFIINSHIADSNYKIFKVNNSNKSPEFIDYEILGFHKKKTIVFGELIKVEYYKEFDGINYSDLVVEENRQYIRDNNGLVTSRIKECKWYYMNGQVGLSKISTKFYTLEEAIEEGIQRRSNIISCMKAYILSEIGLENFLKLIEELEDKINLFIKGSTYYLVNYIENIQKPYLNEQIKQEIIEKLRLN